MASPNPNGKAASAASQPGWRGSLKQQIKAARKREALFQALAFSKTPEARKALAAKLESRLWQNREQPDLSKGNGARYAAHGPAKPLTARP